MRFGKVFPGLGTGNFVQTVQFLGVLMSGDRSQFSPRMVARAIGVSESSLKRWCDQGRLKSTKTVGGHRRLSRAEVVRFLREANLSLADPEAIGLPKVDSDAIRDDPHATETITKALLSADEDTVRQLLTTMYLSGWSLSRIFDDVISRVFNSIGNMWQCNSIEIYKERLSCEIAVNTLREIRTLLPRYQPGAPVAIGATLLGDLYTMPSLMVEMIMVSLGWKAHSLGSNLPLSTLAAAVRDYQPRIFWVSFSHITNEDALIEEFNQFAEALPPSTALAVGGSAINPRLRKQLKFTVCCDNMKQYEMFANNINQITNDLGITNGRDSSVKGDADNS